MKRILALSLLAGLCAFAPLSSEAKKKQQQKPVEELTLSNDKMTVTVSKDGSLKSLKNNLTGTDYAGGSYLWRMYYDSPERKEIEILGENQDAKISLEDGKIIIRYDGLKVGENVVDYDLTLTVSLEDDKVRFASSMTNNAEHTVIREFQYPLVHGMNLPADHKLLTAEGGGKLLSDPMKSITGKAYYQKPDQIMRQYKCKYPSMVFMNCYMFMSDSEGLYFGSHDPLFQDTWHGLRTYCDEKGEFSILDCGFYKYPHCFAGETWTNEANVIAPYSGTWHKASKMYREWADTWFDYHEAPQWVKEMTSWHRVIFKHQYGEYLYKYTDLYGKIKDAGKSVGSNAVIAFGWWEEGMDNGNPDYSPDMAQGGDEAWAEAIKKYQEDGDRLLIYYNGKLIDRGSKFYREGPGKEVCYHDNTGAEKTEQYKFTDRGSWLLEYDSRSFVNAMTAHPIWREKLIEMAQRAYDLGASSVFYDQLGFGESSNTDWDLTREYPVPDVRMIYHKGQSLKYVRDHIEKIDPTGEFALGTESFTDYCAQFCDYIHSYPETGKDNMFPQFYRYTFPEIINTDRGLRDDTDVERRVNITVLYGFRNDIEIYRCRALIDETPKYQAYLAKINEIKKKYASELMLGRYNDVFGFELSNKEVTATSFLSEDGMAVVLTNDRKEPVTLHTEVAVPGYEFVEASTTGSAKVFDGSSVVLNRHDLAVMIFKKK